MKKMLLTTCVVIALAGCGKETVIKEVLVTTPPTEAPAPAVEPDSNKYDQYLDFVNDNSAQARQWTEADLLEMATLVCGAFDNGASLSAVVDVFSNSSTGRYDDELFAAIIGGSVTYLCPEYQSMVQSQL